MIVIDGNVDLLLESFDEENIPWLLEMLKNDVLEVENEKVTKAQFFRVRGDSQEKNTFWKVVSSIAVEKFNMKEVFDMNSTVRLTAIEKLGRFVSNLRVRLVYYSNHLWAIN